MNLMSNARLYQDDGKAKNDLMYEMLPQVKFNMMGQIQIQQELKKPQSSSPFSTPSPAYSSSSSPSSPNRIIGPILDKRIVKEDPILFQSSSTHHHSDQSDFSLSDEPVELRGSRERDEDGEAPLDFSNKKFKFENKKFKKVTKRNAGEEENSSDEPDSPCSRLRNILRMKTPVSNDIEGAVLNLSKDVSADHDWGSMGVQGQKVILGTNRSTSSSPAAGMDAHNYLSSTKQPLSSAGAHPFSFPSSMAQSLGLSPYAILSQGMTPQGSAPVALTPSPRGFDSSNGTLFSHGGSFVTSGSSAYGTAPTTLPQTPSPGGMLPNPISIGKSRMTRPFKAYPKDPLTFPTVGLYGLPVVGPTPGVTEALIHQQSNQAYAEFRKQMLNQTTNSRSKRMSHPKNFTQEPLSDSTTSSTNPMDFGLSGGMGGSEVVGSGSGGEDCLSTSDDGFGGGMQQQTTKSRVKSDEQLKDEAYWERRRKNNEAAKRSRDARRAKEDEIAIRAAFLEQENLKLRFEVCALKNETAKLRCLLYKTQ